MQWYGAFVSDWFCPEAHTAGGRILFVAICYVCPGAPKLPELLIVFLAPSLYAFASVLLIAARRVVCTRTETAATKAGVIVWSLVLQLRSFAPQSCSGWPLLSGINLTSLCNSRRHRHLASTILVRTWHVECYAIN